MGLAQAGLDVTLATTDDNDATHLDVPLNQPVRRDGYDTYYLPRQARFYTASAPLLRWIDQNVAGFDLVHLHAVFSHVSDWAPAIVRRYGKPYGVTPHGILGAWGMRERHTLLKQASYRFLVGPNLRQAAFVHFTSEPEMQQAAIRGALPHSVVIPLGLPLHSREVSSRPRAQADPLTLLVLSRVDPIKSLEILLEAMAHMRAQDCPARLIVAGEGEPTYIRALQDLAGRLGIAGSIDWPGFVKDGDKEHLWEQADVFVLPSRSESFGVAVVEAMAAGLPVVITEGVGIYDAVQKAEAGLVIPCDAEALASALLRLANDAGLRQRLAANGQALVRDRFSLPAMIRSLADLYQDVLPQAERQPSAKRSR
jgi:glycosyltransferase involved in cell wall biosynthesis